MDVSVIIINYNTKQMTSECIDSVIEKTNGIKYEIILVDNASTDGSKEFFEHDKRVKYIYSTENKGFGAGNNLGVKHAMGKYIFLLNSDTLLKNNAIKMLFDFSESQSSPCVCGAWLVDRKNNPNCSHVSFPREKYTQFFLSIFAKKKDLPVDTLQNVDVVCGADMFLSKSIFNEENGFDEFFFLNGEEVELQYRFMKKGYERFLVPGPKIIHFAGASSNGKTNNNLMKNHYYFLKKHMPWHKYYAARIYYTINNLCRWIINPKQINYLHNAFIRIK